MTIKPEIDLTEDAIDLSKVGKTVEGTSFAYFQLDCVGRGVRGLELLKQYPCLRQIDLSRNSIQDVSPIGSLQHLLRLNLAANQIESIEAWGAGALQYLLYLDLSGNKLASLPKLHSPALKTLNLADNLIATCEEFGGHKCLEALVLSGNKLECLKGLCDLPALHTLNLSRNAVAEKQKKAAPAEGEEGEEEAPQEEEEEEDAPRRGSLASLDGLRALPSLRCLDLSSNSLASLEGPLEEMPALQELDLGGNLVAEVKGLAELGRLPTLRRLNAAGNSVEEADGVNLRLEAVMFHKKIQEINGEEVTDEEREEARTLEEQRMEEERQRQEEERQRLEEERLAREEEERVAREAAEEEERARRQAEEEAAAAAAAEAAAAEGEGGEGEGEGEGGEGEEGA